MDTALLMTCQSKPRPRFATHAEVGGRRQMQMAPPPDITPLLPPPRMHGTLLIFLFPFKNTLNTLHIVILYQVLTFTQFDQLL